jgi:quercetin dioxygenase-like cupin family protein
MKQWAVMVVTLITGFTIGIIASQALHAQQGQPQEPLKTTLLLTTDLAEVEGKEVRVTVVQLALGAAGERHFHLGSEFLYVLEGTLTQAAEGMPAVTFKQGEIFQQLPRRIHTVRNPSSTAPAKLLRFQIADKGKPDAVPVK